MKKLWAKNSTLLILDSLRCKKYISDYLKVKNNEGTLTRH